MRTSVAASAKAMPAENRRRRVNFSRAARRDIRQAAALAHELNMHSFRIHGDGTVTWTPKWTPTEAKPKQKSCVGNTGSKTSTSLTPSRAEKSRARQTQFYALLDKASKFRATAVLRWWAKDAGRSIRQRSPPSTAPLASRAPRDGLPDPAPCAAVHAVGASPSRAPPEKTARGGVSCARIVRASARGMSARSEERSRGHARVASAHTMCISPMHSPGGGASTDPRTLPRVPQCDISRESHGVPSGGMDISALPQRAPHDATPHMGHDMMLNAPRMSHVPDMQQAYAQFMSYHMHQGFAHVQAYHMWVEYACKTYGVMIHEPGMSHEPQHETRHTQQ